MSLSGFEPESIGPWPETKFLEADRTIQVMLQAHEDILI